MENIRLQRVLVVSVVLAVGVALAACGGPAAPAATPQPPATAPTSRPVQPTQPLPTPVPPTRPPPATAQPTEASHEPLPAAGALQIIVDNNDGGFSIEEGEWGHCFDGACGGTCWGQDFYYAEPTCPTCRARFRFVVTEAGEYDVWTWWPYGDDRATDTSFTLEYSGGPVVVEVDQRNSGDGWFWLASLQYADGESASIVVEGSSSGFANADAVALTPAGSGPPGEGVAVVPPVGTAEPGEGQVPTPEPAVATATPAIQPTAPSVPPPSGYHRIVFLHHSCGANLIAQGGVRERFAALGYEFYDHGYNGDGLVLADGTWTGRNWDVPDDNTDPDGYAAIFAQPLHSPPDNTFSHLMEYEVIVFKSCFPVSNIGSDEQLNEYKSYYLSIRARMDQYPDRIFVIVTQPPQVQANTDAQEAARARAFTNWLASAEFLSGHHNVFTFNFFNLLADPATNMLRAGYTGDPSDAHPNEQANQAIAPQFVDFVHGAIRTYSAR